MNVPALRFRRSAAATIAVVCLALLFCAPAHAAQSAGRVVRHRPATARPVAPPAPAPTAPPAGAAGMVIAINPETGALVAPTADQVRALTTAEATGLLRTSEGLSEVRLADGSVKLDLQGRFMEYSLVQLDPTGCPRFLCVNDESVLRALLARHASASTPACEEK